MVSGAINHGTDVDFFTFNCTAGVTYTFQFELNVEPFPLRAPDDMNRDPLLMGIFDTDGVTFLLSSHTSDAGEPYDVPPAGSAGGGFILLGDSRFTFTPLITGTYYMAIIHVRDLVGTGNYIFSMASSQIGVTFGRQQEGARHVIGFSDADPPELEFEGNLSGAIVVAINAAQRLWAFGFNVEVIIFNSSDVFEDPVVHIHNGFANAFDNRPHFSINNDGNNPHEFAGSFDFPIGRRNGEDEPNSVQIPDGNGGYIDVPAVFNVTEITKDGKLFLEGEVVVDFSETRGGVGFLFGSFSGDSSAGEYRTFTGTDWYLDVHTTNNLDVIPRPVAVSYQNGGIYNVFETWELLDIGTFFFDPTANSMTSANVVPTIVGSNPSMDLAFNAALQTFQITNHLYLATEPDDDTVRGLEVNIPNPYAGFPIKVYSGGIGEVGSEIVDLGVVPVRRPEREFYTTDIHGFTVSSALMGTPVKQLSDDEMEELRDAFYTDGGWYVQILDPFTNQPLVRADGEFYEIQTTPNDSFPFPIRDSGYTRGTINFVSEYAEGGSITVIANGEILGELTDAVDTVPECGEDAPGQKVSDDLIPQEYPYRAFAEDGTEWSGHFTLANGECATIVLTGDNAE